MSPDCWRRGVRLFLVLVGRPFGSSERETGLDALRFLAVAAASVAMAGCFCGLWGDEEGGEDEPEDEEKPHVTIDQPFRAAGDHRLLRSPDGSYAVAEIRGRWQHAEFPHTEIDHHYYEDRGDHVPGVVKLIDENDEVIETVAGWPLGPPDDEGRFLYLEEAPHEFAYKVRSTAQSEGTALDPPDGYWHVKAAVGAPETGCAAAIFRQPVYIETYASRVERRRERLWVASLDWESLEVRATRTLETTTPWTANMDEGVVDRHHWHRYGVGVAAGTDGDSSTVAVVGTPARTERDSEWPRWSVTALDCETLDTRWEKSLPRPEGLAADHETTVAKERIHRSAFAAFSEDGSRLAVLYGSISRGAPIGRPWLSPVTLYILSNADGAVDQIGGVSDVPKTTRLVPVSGSDAFALLHVSTSEQIHGSGMPTPFGHGTTRTTSEHFEGVGLVDLGSGEIRLAVDPEGLSSAARSTLGSASFDTSVSKVKSKLRDWHRSGRRAVDRRDAWLRDRVNRSLFELEAPSKQVARDCDRPAIEKILEQKRSDFETCFEREGGASDRGQETSSDPAAVQWQTDGEGTVIFARLIPAGPAGEGVRDCIVERIEQTDFPAPESGQYCRVQFPVDALRENAPEPDQ